MSFLTRFFLITTLLYLSIIQTYAGGIDVNERIIAKESEALEPWFTGPLIAASGRTVPAHHIVFEPYLYVTDILGKYDDHWKPVSAPNALILNPLILFRYGITNSFEIKVITDLPSNFRQHSHDTRMGDFQFAFGFQILEERKNSWIPDLRLELKQNFPTGHYQHLNPNKHKTDATGFGVYQTGVAFDFQKIFLIGIRLLRIRWTFDYLASPPTHIEGFNTYGGGYGTNGKVKLGDRFFSVLAFEYTFTQNWIAAIDIVYDMNHKISFSGNPGKTKEGIPAIMTAPSRKQFSLAPAIEYAFNGNLGIVFGPWFSIAGKNSTRFISGVIAINYYH